MNTVDCKFWKNKKVLLTGHTGFKGSWLALWLEALGARVVGYALPPATDPSLFEVSGIGDRMESILADITDQTSLETAVRACSPDVVLHLAAQSLVRESYEQPVKTFETNVLGTVNVLEVIRTVRSIKAAVIVTSDKCYENMERGGAFVESDPLGGRDPYSASKGCADIATAAYRNAYFDSQKDDASYIGIATARGGNVIGGGDWAKDRLVPDAVRAWSTGERLVIRYPNAVRPWQHVLELLRGYLLLAQKLYEEGPAYAEAWNFGPAPEDEQSVSAFISRFSSNWGVESEYSTDTGYNPAESETLRLESAKARTRLGWSPSLSLDDAISATADWYRAYLDGEDMARFSVQQIDELANLFHI